jgi:hypothetical protein
MIKCHERGSNKDWEDSAEGILSWLDHQQSILEESQPSTKVPTQFPKDLLNTVFLDTDGHSELYVKRGSSAPGDTGRVVCICRGRRYATRSYSSYASNQSAIWKKLCQSYAL